MGSYLNPQNVLFRQSLNSEIYVDKTKLIHFTNKIMNTENNMICVSRPRRFGKSMALKMLSAYYSKGCDSRELFADLKVCSPDEKRDKAGNMNDKELAERRKAVFDRNLNSHDVILIDMQGVIGKVTDLPEVQEELRAFYERLPHMSDVEKKNVVHPQIQAMQKRIIEDIRKCEEYAAYILENECFLGNALKSIYEKTGHQFVILIDEWDCVFRNNEEDKLLQDKYIEWLRKMFKDNELLPVYSLVYMTGILPIKRYGTESALNNFDEYTFLKPGELAEFTGFTEKEVEELCRWYDVDFDEMSRWYNGYVFKKVGRIYNPRSVTTSLMQDEFGSYWTSTGTYESVKKQIEQNFEGLREMVIRMLGGGRCKIDINGFQNDMVTFANADDVLTFLVHLGYLGYDAATEEVYIPNKEIRGEFVRSIRGEKYARTYEAVSKSAELLKATLEGDENTVADMVEQAHTEHASILKYNDENALSCIVQIAYYQAQDDYKMFRELPSGKGFADVVFLPRPGRALPAIVVELKWDDEAVAAIEQIKKRQYGEALKDYVGEVLLVGISYDKDIEKGNKRHTCKIEKVGK